MPLPFTLAPAAGLLPVFKPRVGQKPTPANPTGLFAGSCSAHRLLLWCRKRFYAIYGLNQKKWLELKEGHSMNEKNYMDFSSFGGII